MSPLYRYIAFKLTYFRRIIFVNKLYYSPLRTYFISSMNLKPVWVLKERKYSPKFIYQI
jgi:hypothetical protein